MISNIYTCYEVMCWYHIILAMYDLCSISLISFELTDFTRIAYAFCFNISWIIRSCWSYLTHNLISICMLSDHLFTVYWYHIIPVICDFSYSSRTRSNHVWFSSQLIENTWVMYISKIMCDLYFFMLILLTHHDLIYICNRPSVHNTLISHHSSYMWFLL